jgi:hypothetical protein
VHSTFYSDVVAIKLNTTAGDHADAIATAIPSLIKLLDEGDADSQEEAASAVADLAAHGLLHLSIVEKQLMRICS